MAAEEGNVLYCTYGVIHFNPVHMLCPRNEMQNVAQLTQSTINGSLKLDHLPLQAVQVKDRILN